jgi:hypothetical protein
MFHPDAPMKALALFLPLFVLAACTTGKPPYWSKPQTTSDQTYTDLSECRYQVGLAKVPSGERELMEAHCMRGKGYRLLANDS